MKCVKPNTDQSCEVWISTGKKPYTEYMANPDAENRTSKPDIIESFIPVNDGEQITVNIKFSGSVLHGAADVLADGAFVYDRRIEGDRRGKVKHQVRNWKMEEFYNVPGSLDTATMQTGNAVVGGSLSIKQLDDNEVPLYVKNGSKLGLGTIAVLISVNQHNIETYPHAYKGQTIGKWRDSHLNYADGGVKPLHELAFKLEDDEVHFNRQQRHKRHGEQVRFGTRPWAVFVFHYRSQSSIQSSGCVLRPDRLVVLTPHIGEFIFADPNAIMKKRLATRAKNEQQKQEAREEEMEEEEEEEEEEDEDESRYEHGYDGYDQFSNARSLSGSERLFVSRSSSHSEVEQPKKRLLGNKLALHGGPTHASRKDSHVPEGDLASFSQGNAQTDEGWQGLFRDEPTNDGPPMAQQDGFHHMTSNPHNSISGENQGDGSNLNLWPDLQPDELSREIDRALESGGWDVPQGPGAALVAQMMPPPSSHDYQTSYPQQGHANIVQSVENMHQQEFQPRPSHLQYHSSDFDEDDQTQTSGLAQLVSNSVQHQVDESKAAKEVAKAARIEAKSARRKESAPPQPKGKPVFDPTEKTGYGFGNPKMASKQHMAPTREAMQQLDAQDQNTQGMLQNYLQGQTGGTMHGMAAQQAVPYQRPWEIAPSAKPQSQQHLMSPPQRTAKPSTTNITSPHSPQASPHTPALASAIPHKRSASVISHTSTASANKRRAARKAMLTAQVEEKRKAKAAAERRLEEERRARDEMERRREEQERADAEAEEADLAALEAEAQELDAEVAAVDEVGRREADEARMRELEREREGMQ